MFVIHHSSAFCEIQLFYLLNRVFKLELSRHLSPQLQTEKVSTGSDRINNRRWDVSDAAVSKTRVTVQNEDNCDKW